MRPFGRPAGRADGAKRPHRRSPGANAPPEAISIADLPAGLGWALVLIAHPPGGIGHPRFRPAGRNLGARRRRPTVGARAPEKVDFNRRMPGRRAGPAGTRRPPMRRPAPWGCGPAHPPWGYPRFRPAGRTLRVQGVLRGAVEKDCDPFPEPGGLNAGVGFPYGCSSLLHKSGRARHIYSSKDLNPCQG